ncbi:MAG: hypothetical protein KA116_01760 [Proteobacteria bacterium]|nr:hypothetical protein [Pseudomonadota bacterium]
MNTKQIITLIFLVSVLSGVALPSLPNEMHAWILKMQKAQIELLKIDWGQPELCTERDRDYNDSTRLCGKRRKLTERRYPK